MNINPGWDGFQSPAGNEQATVNEVVVGVLATVNVPFRALFPTLEITSWK
jgi:hypothetical protein